jgi:hypothetical protein
MRAPRGKKYARFGWPDAFWGKLVEFKLLFSAKLIQFPLSDLMH